MTTYIWAIIILLIVLAGQIFGISGGYVSTPLFDVPMHIIGGVGIALFICGFLNARKTDIGHKIKITVIGVLVAGLVWEYFEIHYNLTGYRLWTNAYYLDTLKDLVDDIIGGLLVAYFYWRKW